MIGIQTRVIAILLLALSGQLWAQLEVTEASIAELQAAMATGETSAQDLVEYYLARIEAYDKQGPVLNSIIRINPAARDEARRLDEERQAGNVRGPLHGIPIVLKDNYNTSFMPTTGGSVALANFQPHSNAMQVDKLLAAGAIVLAKTNLHEYAYGITTISSIAGQTRNPYDLRRVPGGSSGGTAAAIAASFAAVGMGSDTCGSIRIPAAFNNLVGLRPSKGLSSIYGIMPLSSTQDVGGPLARTVEDLAVVLDATLGIDEQDAATVALNDFELPSFLESLDTVDLSALRLGRLDAYMDRASAAVRGSIDDALAWFEEQGAEIISVELEELSSLIAVSGVIGHEFKPDLNQYLALFLSEDIANLNDIVDQGLYHEAVAGTLRRSQASVSNPESYQQAIAARESLQTLLETALAELELDAVVYPPIAELPVMIGNSQPDNNCSISANSGLPAISIPLGFTADGLPVAMEALGSFLQDTRLLNIAYTWEQARAPRQPPATTPPLVNAQAPAPTMHSTLIQEGGIDLRLDYSIDIPGNRFSYSVAAGDSSQAEVYALTLQIDEEDVFGRSEPVVANLLSPQQQIGVGDIFMSPAFRQALNGGRVYLRLFAEGLPTAGVVQVLQQN